MSLWQLPAWFAWLLASMAAMVVLATGWLATAAQGGNASAGSRQWFWGLVLGVPLLAMAAYAKLGHPVAANPVLHLPDNAAETMVSKLAAKLQANPDDPAGWLMLARSQKVLGKLPESDLAYEQARALVLTQVDDLADWIQVRLDLAQGRFNSQTQELVAAAARLDPAHESVLLFSGLLAIDQGRYPQAMAHLQRLQTRYEAGSADHDALTQVLAQLKAGQDPRKPPGAGAATQPEK